MYWSSESTVLTNNTHKKSFEMKAKSILCKAVLPERQGSMFNADLSQSSFNCRVFGVSLKWIEAKEDKKRQEFETVNNAWCIARQLATLLEIVPSISNAHWAFVPPSKITPVYVLHGTKLTLISLWKNVKIQIFGLFRWHLKAQLPQCRHCSSSGRVCLIWNLWWIAA